VRSQLCLGARGRAALARFRLAQMGYRETGYLRYVSNFNE
jgi:hypothetical protein